MLAAFLIWGCFGQGRDDPQLSPLGKEVFYAKDFRFQPIWLHRVETLTCSLRFALQHSAGARGSSVPTWPHFSGELRATEFMSLFEPPHQLVSEASLDHKTAGSHFWPPSPALGGSLPAETSARKHSCLKRDMTFFSIYYMLVTGIRCHPSLYTSKSPFPTLL